MSIQFDQPLPKPFGAALQWSNEDLERIAEVTPADIEAARLHWMAYAPNPYKSLLDAVEME